MNIKFALNKLRSIIMNMNMNIKFKNILNKNNVFSNCFNKSTTINKDSKQHQNNDDNDYMSHEARVMKEIDSIRDNLDGIHIDPRNLRYVVEQKIAKQHKKK